MLCETRQPCKSFASRSEVQRSESAPEEEVEVGSPLTQPNFADDAEPASLNADLGISTWRVLDKVSSGRSEAKTSGSSEWSIAPRRGARSLARLQPAHWFERWSGGLRTTGYYL